MDGPAEKPEEKGAPELAICLWQPDASSAQMIESLRVSGVTAVEPGPPFLLHGDEKATEAAAERFRAAGIAIYSCHAPFSAEDDVSQLDDQKRLIASDRQKNVLARTALAGAKCMVIHPSGPVDESQRAGRLDCLRLSLESLVRAAEDAGIVIALENMVPGCIGSDSDELRRLVNDFDSQFLRVCFDTGHSNMAEEGAPAALANLREIIIGCHLQDNDGNSDQHIQPPYGSTDWEALASDLVSMDLACPLAVEALPWNGAGVAQLLREVRALLSGGLLTVALADRRIRAVCPQCRHYCFGTPQDWFCACSEE